MKLARALLSVLLLVASVVAATETAVVETAHYRLTLPAGWSVRGALLVGPSEHPPEPFSATPAFATLMTLKRRVEPAQAKAFVEQQIAEMSAPATGSVASNGAWGDAVILSRPDAWRDDRRGEHVLAVAHVKHTKSGDPRDLRSIVAVVTNGGLIHFFNYTGNRYQYGRDQAAVESLLRQLLRTVH